MIWLDFTPQSGREQKGRRSAIIISNDFFNSQTGLCLVCPITSTKRDYPLHIPIDHCDKMSGYIMVEQIKSVDFMSRNAEFITRVSEEQINEVLSRLYACL